MSDYHADRSQALAMRLRDAHDCVSQPKFSQLCGKSSGAVIREPKNAYRRTLRSPQLSNLVSHCLSELLRVNVLNNPEDTLLQCCRYCLVQTHGLVQP